jgi:nucleoside-diphosphate-sugar epimerase
MKIFLAGATGAIGRRLVPLLLSAGHDVVGTTRSTTKADGLWTAGVKPVVVDVFDAPALSVAVLEAQPDIVAHQLTDLPPGLDPSKMSEGTRRNARMRTEGTQNLVAAALGAGVRRLVAQSIAWMYAPAKEPHSEDDVLDIDAGGTRAITVAGVATLERLTMSSPPIDGVVLRYGHLYGPGTGTNAAETPALHVDAAALGGGAGDREGASRHLQHRRTERIPLHEESTARARFRCQRQIECCRVTAREHFVAAIV